MNSNQQAYDGAYRRTIEGKSSLSLWGHVLSLFEDEYTRQSLMTSAHAPAQFRANGPVSNVDGFYEAFDVKATDKLFRPAAERVRIW